MIARLKQEAVLNVTNAEQTLANVEVKEVEDVKKAELPELEVHGEGAKDVAKAVADAEGPMIPVDAEGQSKNGGECPELVQPGALQKEREKQDRAMKDVENVASRKVEESMDAQAELLAQIQERDAMLEESKKKIVELNRLCTEALAAQRQQLAERHGKEMEIFFEQVIAQGEAMEKELTAAAEKSAKIAESTKKQYESSLKLTKKLVEAVKAAQPKKEMTRYMTAAARAQKIA